jgi:hypothetical protein
MWNWLNCYLSGRHDFGISCQPGAIFLRCIHCGKRSSGWALENQSGSFAPAIAQRRDRTLAANAGQPLPFRPRGVGRLHSA